MLGDCIEMNIDQVETKLLCAVDNHIYVCHICAKGYLDSKFNSDAIDKISIFHKIAPNLT